ncbi:hypothetical protein M406DRAFT_105962 [Cryphonectria parasitica EP155]|uniref:Peptidase S54 rhomboid domain-containing protein n=1 Tax=Cryphonectria parasitica (strain ATCC 38755 / EP155) TaxID=660469 RepID=A0A9P5CQ16_CRYP1|nr:uncharacterized protein M406DRAFT_105962 [Cryphonectria parasitica EP155]KAF3765771.1 hypothetical protein M406DRAFT_105962 [Cryphonectria parasitica EP155]
MLWNTPEGDQKELSGLWLGDMDKNGGGGGGGGGGGELATIVIDDEQAWIWSYQQVNWSQHPVRIVGPAIWSITAVSTIYFTFAAWDVYQDVKGYSKESRRGLTFDRIEADRLRKLRARRRTQESVSSSPFSGGPIVVTSPSSVWNSLSGPDQVVASVAAVNLTTLALSRAPSDPARRFVLGLAHTPVEGPFRNRQLLTSSFVHTGPLHLFMNMFVLFNFGHNLANSSQFMGSGTHTAAFYLSAGIISALGSHISTRFWPNKSHRFRPGVGFSGVVSTIFAAWCTERPDSRLRILPLPWSFSARDLLEFSVGFETLGVLGLWRYLRLPLDVAFACHLTGLAFGAAYVTYGKAGRFWTHFRGAAFRTMQFTRLV